MLDLNKSLVVVGGVIHLESTLRAVADAVTAYNSTHENDLEKVAGAVHAVFDDYLGTAINIPALKSLALNKLNGITPDSFVEMSERVGEYVRSNPEVFSVTKGPKGGVRRICDQK